jgi:hypothetical protein
LAGPAAISVLQGAKNGLQRSQDFQWSGAHLLGLGIDPFQQQLQHDPQHMIVLTQVPNYLHELYVVLWPLGLLSQQRAAAVWVVLNVCFALAAVAALGSLYALGTGRTVLLGLLLAISTPFRIALGNGQQCLLELLLLVAAVGWARRASPRGTTGTTFAGGFVLGLSYFKYSFSPIVMFFLALSRRLRLVVLSLLVPVAGWLAFSMRVHRSPLATAMEPLTVSRTGVSQGDADLATLLPLVIAHSGTVALGVCLLLSVALAYGIVRRQSELLVAFASIAVADLALFPHLTYDFVLLAIPLALLLQGGRRSGWPAAMSAASIFVLWYVFKLLPPRGGAGWEIASISVHMALLLVLGLGLLMRQPRLQDTLEVSGSYAQA